MDAHLHLQNSCMLHHHKQKKTHSVMRYQQQPLDLCEMIAAGWGRMNISMQLLPHLTFCYLRMLFQGTSQEMKRQACRCVLLEAEEKNSKLRIQLHASVRGKRKFFKRTIFSSGQNYTKSQYNLFDLRIVLN